MNEKAFTRLADRLRERLFWVAFRLLGVESEAEDIVQETLIKLWREENQGRKVRSPMSWSKIVATRLSLDRLRKPRPIPMDLDVALENPQAGPSEQFQWRQRHEKLMRGLMQLSPQRRAVAVLCLIEGHSAVEAAHIMEISPSSVRTHLQLAKEDLRPWT